AALRNDAVLREMLDTPLMLSIVALAYAEKSAVDVQAAETPDERWQHLFDAYIAAMFKRRKATSYAEQQATHWLSWLAKQIVHHSQTVYYIERMQPDWLAQHQRRHYVHTFRLLSGLIFGLLGGLFLGLAGALSGGPTGGLVGALSGGLVGGLLGGLDRS